MNDDFEQKRKARIESFSVHFEDDIADPQPPEEPVEEENYSIDLQSDSGSDEVVSYGEPPEEEISSYSGTPVQTTEKPKRSELRKAKRMDKRRRKYKAKKNQVIFRMVWWAMILFVSISLAEFLMVGVNDVFAIGREEAKSVSVTIPKNVTLDQITEILVKNKVINSPAFFKLYATLTKNTTDFTNGTFEIATNKDYQALINYLQSDQNRTDVVRVTFSEGFTVTDFAASLENNKVCSSEDFLAKVNSTEFDEDYTFLQDIKNSAERYYRLEGYLFPDTYDFYVGEDPSSVVRKFLANYRNKLFRTKIRFEKKEKKQTIEERAAAMGMTMEEVVNLASLIQAEAANKEDMYYVSSVLHNRLKTLETGGENEYGEGGLSKLQLDSTVFYPYHSRNDVPIAQRNTYESKYSTYQYVGLPAGPICNPGLAAIEAAVNPKDTDYYYFCHKAPTEDEPAEAYYAETNDEHMYNLERAGLL